jgi:hypothetical protein
MSLLGSEAEPLIVAFESSELSATEILAKSQDSILRVESVMHAVVNLDSPINMK